MKEIQLSRAMVALVDDEDYKNLNQYNWQAHKSYKTKNTHYATRHTPTINGKRGFVSMHSSIMGNEKGKEIDHIDGDGLNNQRSNLRQVTHRENGQNLHIEKSSKYVGVHWGKKDKLWYAQIMIKGKRIYLGSYKDEEIASKAYTSALSEVKGV